jgi:histidine ammonia-lyase
MTDVAAFRLGEETLTAARLVALAAKPDPALSVSHAAKDKVRQYRAVVYRVLSDNRRVYGINTGFGFLSDVAIEPDKLEQLQANLVRSHACGVGPAVADEVVRALLVLRAHTFCLGHSGIRWEVIEQTLAFLRHDILPVIPCQGSVGASGDLAPLAHLALGLMGEGDVRVKGEMVPAAQALKAFNLKPLVPQAKEGLALINGTHFMTTIGAFAVHEAKVLARTADVAASMSLDAIRGTTRAFDERVHLPRGQAGQALVAGNVRRLFSTADEIVESHKYCGKVQDPYSFRCVPQVHGASRDAIDHAERIVQIDLNSVTDNPVVMLDGDVVSGGNFHGQPVALVMDFLAIAVAELGSIAERRVEKLTNPHLSGLPAFVTKDSGLNSGFMIPHVVTAALVSENKILCHPASVDSIPTSADKEDHVSMGPIAARKARDVIANVRNVLAIELLTAAQGIDLLAPLKPSKALAAVFGELRAMAARMDKDRSLHRDIAAVSAWIGAEGPLKAVAAAGCWLD